MSDISKINLTAHLPKEINESLSCFSFVNSKVIEGAPDIVTCNKNEYMYEIKRKKIVRCLNLRENAKSISCYYIPENEKLTIFYLILTSSKRLLIIRRTDKYLKIVRTYDTAMDYEVFDFQCLGLPQISITVNDKCGTLLCNFPVESQVEDKCTALPNFMSEYLTEELQMLNKHIDDLSEECKHLRKMCFSSTSPMHLEKISVGSVSFLLPFNENICQKLTVSNKWYNVYGGHLILGLRLCNVGSNIVRNIEFMIDETRIKDYSCRYFRPLSDVSVCLYLPPEICQSVKPGEEICVVGAFRVPEYTAVSEFCASCCITSSPLKECLVRETFQLTAWNLASKTTNGIEERFTVEDLMAIMTVQCETRVKIQMDVLENESLETVLVENLGFIKIKHLKDKLFYCTSTCLKEVLVAVRPHATNPCVWFMVMWTRESSQSNILIHALYELLPDNAVILCDDVW